MKNAPQLIDCRTELSLSHKTAYPTALRGLILYPGGSNMRSG